MAEDKTFRYGLIVLGFFLIMIGMFIMSVDKPHIYITFCSMGVFMVFVGITWSICQCYPKITFTPVEAVHLSEKSPMCTSSATPEKQWSTSPYTSSKEAERYEATLPSYEQIQIKVEELGEPELDQSIPPLPQAMVMGLSQPKLQAKVEIHRNSVGKEENGMADAICQFAPLASLKEDTNVTTSDDGRSSASSLHSCEDWQKEGPHKQDASVQFGGPFSGDVIDLIDTPQCDGIAMVDAQLCEAVYPSCQLPKHDDTYIRKEQPSFTLGPSRDSEVDDLYYGIKDETDDLVPAYESDLEQ